MEFPDLHDAKKKIISKLAVKINVSPAQIRVLASPYRICPLGAHIDHQGGPVLGMTIDSYTLLAYVPTDTSNILLESSNYPGEVTFALDHIPESTESHWGDYIRAAVLALSEQFEMQKGITGIVTGMLPGCGLSSSASVLLAYLHAFCEANGICPAPWDYVRLTRRAENHFMGLNNGILDQTSIVFGRKDSLVHIDTKKEEIMLYPAPPAWTGYRILVAFSGYTRELTTSGYNSRVQECREAAEALAGMANLSPPKRLSDIPEEMSNRFSHRLPSLLSRRARHYFGEVQRVNSGIHAWEKDRMDVFGKLMFESYQSSVDFYECGIPALYDLQRIVCSTKGIVGSRFMGGGFGGCVVGFIENDHASTAEEQILPAYKKLYPEVADKSAVYLTRSADGIRFL